MNSSPAVRAAGVGAGTSVHEGVLGAADDGPAVRREAAIEKQLDGLSSVCS